ncbi:hypothetical protein DFQ05_2481 [Winogradskyella wandonensis]|uniref:Lipoprotein n=1 Tax=Winogradskyella wandonensis TaxID=1442586 RepID=A0A4R1KKI3_9FLAO|nr:hypothetical protein [Winogradskyella wandonensis]TCK65264.1 hypothetical protein DFQ05_2481 [Winogradskyella wandonensis]
MKKLIVILTFLSFLTSCNVTETIVFNEDGSGEFISSFDMGEMMAQMKAMGGDTEKKEKGKVMDTTMVFADMMEIYKDSIAALPEDKQATFEAIKDMYMTMKMDEDSGEMNMGIGMKFKSIEDLKGIQEKIKKAQSINQQADQVDMMKNQSPLGALEGGNDKVDYNMTANGFSRKTTVGEKSEEEIEELNSLFNDEADEMSKEFLKYFEASKYTIKLVFPKKIKSVSVEGAKISDDGKTVTYAASWMDYIKNPELLDVDVTFYE